MFSAVDKLYMILQIAIAAMESLNGTVELGLLIKK